MKNSIIFKIILKKLLNICFIIVKQYAKLENGTMMGWPMDCILKKGVNIFQKYLVFFLV